MALRWAGKLCAGCSASKCVDCPSKAEPALVECPVCESRGCAECKETGYFELTTCPAEFVDVDAAQAVRFAELFKKGVPPVAGGALDQESWFMGFCENWWGEQADLERA